MCLWEVYCEYLKSTRLAMTAFMFISLSVMAWYMCKMCGLCWLVCVSFLAGLLRDKSNLEAVKNEALDGQASIEEKSRVFIEQQQQKIEELVQQKVCAVVPSTCLAELGWCCQIMSFPLEAIFVLVFQSHTDLPVIRPFFSDSLALPHVKEVYLCVVLFVRPDQFYPMVHRLSEL